MQAQAGGVLTQAPTEGGATGQQEVGSEPVKQVIPGPWLAKSTNTFVRTQLPGVGKVVVGGGGGGLVVVVVVVLEVVVVVVGGGI